MGDDVLVSEYRHYCQLLWSGQHIYEANQWLLHFSSQIHCWKYCLEIIHNPHAVYSLHEIFFAIKILHQYLQARWELLDPESYPFIKEVSVCLLIATLIFLPQILFRRIFQSQGEELYANPLIQNQLCCVLAAYYCRTNDLNEINAFQVEILLLDRTQHPLGQIISLLHP
jgi:hypothetical protein